jgi:hypothetical protein
MIEHHELFSGVVDALYASVAGGVGQDRAERGDQLEDDLEAREAGERPR